ncbi:hypothetical protein DFH09DRAFT_1100180 [Mycena vulgaris]|nr:hypothetical protein DFH09DRAFT_1100180 [Mycena vulgaris]
MDARRIIWFFAPEIRCAGYPLQHNPGLKPRSLLAQYLGVGTPPKSDTPTPAHFLEGAPVGRQNMRVNISWRRRRRRLYYRGGPNEERTGTVPTYTASMYAIVDYLSNDTTEMHEPSHERAIVDGKGHEPNAGYSSWCTALKLVKEMQNLASRFCQSQKPLLEVTERLDVSPVQKRLATLADVMRKNVS